MYQYGYGYSRSLSSRPSYFTAPNGLNFSRSIGNPNSRLEKVRSYLRTNGKSTKRDILTNVFGKVVDNTRYNYGKGTVTRGWGVYLFTYGLRHGFFKKERIGNKVFYSIP